MANMSWSVLKQRPARIDTFTDKFANGDEFVFTDGRSFVVNKVRVGRGGGKIDYTPNQSDALNTVMVGAPSSRFDIKLIINNREIPFGNLEKTSEFGGQSVATTNRSVTFGGVKTEVLSEVGFCFYYAMQVNGHLTARSGYSASVWQQISNTRQFAQLCRQYTGTSRMLSYQFKDRANMNNHLQDMYLFLTQEGWDAVLRRQVVKFQNDYHIGNQYFLSRGDGFPDYFNPYVMWRTIRKAMKVTHGLGTQVVGEDKWNPADVWVVNAQGINHLKALKRRADKLKNIGDDQYTVGLMNTVNRHLSKWYSQKSVIPVSLKKSGSRVSIREINMGTEDVEQIIRYQDALLSFSNQDVQLNFDVITFRKGTNQRVGNPLQLRMKMKTGSGGYRLEIEERRSGATARHGSIGVGLQQFIIYGTNRTGIERLKQIRNESEFDNIKNNFPSGGQNWMGILEFKGMTTPQVLLPYVNRLLQEINGPGAQPYAERLSATPEGPINKAGAGELAVAIDKISDRHARDITVENLYHAAGSSGVRAGISPAQLQARQTSLGLSDDDLIDIQGNTRAALTVFNGGPHIKIS